MTLDSMPPAPPPPGDSVPYRCTACKKLFFHGYLPVGAWIEIYCPRCRWRNIIKGASVWRPTPLT